MQFITFLRQCHASLGLTLVLCGCATSTTTAPIAPPITATTEPISKIIAPAICPVCVQCMLCPPVITPPETPVTAPKQGRLEKRDWSSLPQWGSDDPTASLNAFVQGCEALKNKPVWKNLCAQTSSVGKTAAEITSFFQTQFDPWQAINGDDTTSGVITGYYEPLLRGSRTRSAKFPYPIYAPPQDLLTIDLSELYPELKNRRLRGRLVGNKVVPYFDRGAIDTRSEPLQGLEIAYVDSAVELFFLHIQGSGQVQLEDGTRIRIGYADQNGHPFRSMGTLLVRKGEMTLSQTSMQGIKDWAQKNPKKVQEFMNGNPSYVFFKEMPNEASGPIGTLNVPLTAERSIAVDRRAIPLGVPVYLATTFPNTNDPLNRLMMAQDTGGAINGTVRADFFWGFGDAAGAQAGKMKQQGQMWVLLPKGREPKEFELNVTP